MPKVTFSTDQQTWLWSHFKEFSEAKANKTTARFLPPIYTQFHSQWPVPQPSPEEISGAGSFEKARTNKQKKSEIVCDDSLFITAPN